jgi:hypothetical protein
VMEGMAAYSLNNGRGVGIPIIETNWTHWIVGRS